MKRDEILKVIKEYAGGYKKFYIAYNILIIDGEVNEYQMQLLEEKNFKSPAALYKYINKS